MINKKLDEIQNSLELIEQLVNDNDYLQRLDEALDRQNKRIIELEKLNNANYQSFIEVNHIINEFDKFLFEELQTYGGGGIAQEYYDKLQELKGSE